VDSRADGFAAAPDALSYCAGGPGTELAGAAFEGLGTGHGAVFGFAASPVASVTEEGKSQRLLSFLQASALALRSNQLGLCAGAAAAVTHGFAGAIGATGAA